MGQFDVHRNADKDRTFPYLLDIQSDLLDHLATLVVVPLIGVEAIDESLPRLNPQFFIEDTPVMMLTTQMRGVRLARLGDVVANLADHRDEIVAAIDVVIASV